MAGSTANILFPARAATAVASWKGIVAFRASMVEGHDFWVRSASVNGPSDPSLALPFYYRVVQRAEPEWALGDDDETSIATAFGFIPALAIDIGAMCRGSDSDRILGELALAVLDKHEGALLFDGLLSPSLDRAHSQRWLEKPGAERAALFLQAIDPHPGKVAVTFIDGEPSGHVVDGAFLAFWMKHAAFHFVN